MKVWRAETGGLFAVLCGALIIRLLFAVGFVGGYPQDDGIYIGIARSIAHGALDLSRYKTISPGFVANPAETFTFRVGYTYPLALLFRLFGEGDASAIWPGLLSSLAGIAVTAALTAELFGRRAGLFAALLLATLPHDILSSTRVLADAPLGLWVAAGALALFIGWRTAHVGWFIACGLMLGVGYLVKDAGIVLFLFIAPFVAGYAVPGRRWPVLAAYIAGFLLCLFLEGLWYQARTGHFFLHPLVAHSVTVYKYTQEPHSSLQVLPFLRVDWVEEFFLIGAVLLGFAKETYYQFSGFGLTYWVIAAGLMWTVIRPSDPKVRILLALAVSVYLYLEFGPVGLTMEHGTLIYRGIYKHLRYVSLLNPLAVPFAGLALAELWRRHRGFAVAVTLAVIASGVPSLLHDYPVLRASQQDLRVAAAFLRPSNATVYTDYLGVSSLRYHSRGDSGGVRFRDLQDIQDPRDLHDSYVVLGGSRGLEVLSDYVLQVIPSWAREMTAQPSSAPASWDRVLTVEGSKEDATRRFDLVIFRVP